MANIAIICEGISENKILQHMATRACGPHTFNAIQPKITQDTLKQDGFGGWKQVLDHCNEETFDAIFQFNDYLIIQIDTDASEIAPYNVAKNDNSGHAKSQYRLHCEIKHRLLKNVPRGCRKKYSSRIIFAICHNEIECWLLPLYHTGAAACKTTNCIYTLNRALSKKNLPGIPDKDKNCDMAQKAYRNILKQIRKPADVEHLAACRHGCAMFLEGLYMIKKGEEQ